MPTESIALTFGVVLAAALIAGMLADLLRLPKVTGYLLMGVALGSSGADLLSDHAHELEPLTELAIGLVLFSMGSQFPLPVLRRIAHRVIRLSAGELIATFCLVSAGILLMGKSLSMALLLGTLALATAPATTVLVLRETESEGQLTDSVGALVVVNNIVSIVLFELVFLAIQVMGSGESAPLAEQVLPVIQSLFGSIFLGGVMGLLISLACSLVASSRWLVLLIATMMLMLGIAEHFEIPFMLSFLTMGLTVANASDDARQLDAMLNRLTGFLCVVFFVIHGAELDLSAFMKAGAVGVVYVACRSLGKYFGIMTAASLSGDPPEVRRWLGTALLAQAGAAIALATAAVRRDPELGVPIQTLVLGTVVFFEIAGPLLIRQSVLRAGEVPLAQAVHHTSSTPWDEVIALWHRILRALGHEPVLKRPADEIMVSDLTRKNVSGLNQSAAFSEVIELIAHSHDNTYAVINDHSDLVGIIRYSELSQVMFDRSVGSLIRADDLTSPAIWILSENEPVDRAIDVFRRTADDCLPVLSSDEERKYVGVIRRRDVMKLVAGLDPELATDKGSGH